MRLLPLATLLVGAACLLFPCALAAEEPEGRNPDQRFELEGHFGFYGNIAFPSTRSENPRYTAFLLDETPPELASLFRPALRSNNFRREGGLRASFDVTPRWAVEYGLTFTQRGNLRLSDFYMERVIPDALTLFPTLRVVRLRRQDGGLLMHSLNAVYHLRQRGRFVPYLTGGLTTVNFDRGGEVHFIRTIPLLTVIDVVLDRYGFFHSEDFTRLGFNAGAGFKLYTGPHFGFRTDARFLWADTEFTQSGFIQQPIIIDPNVGGPTLRRNFRPNITAHQRGLYSNLHVTFGIFGRF